MFTPSHLTMGRETSARIGFAHTHDDVIHEGSKLEFSQ